MMKNGEKRKMQKEKNSECDCMCNIAHFNYISSFVHELLVVHSCLDVNLNRSAFYLDERKSYINSFLSTL